MQITFADMPKLISMYQQRLDAVVKGSAQEVARRAQLPRSKGGRMPVDTGNLRNSFQSSLNGSTALTGPESYVMVAAAMQAGDIAEFGWGAIYGRRVNYGFTGQDSKGRTYNQQGAHFLEGAAAEWQNIVRGEVAKAMAAVGGGR